MFKIERDTDSSGTVSDKCKVESFKLVVVDGSLYKDMPDLDGHSGYKLLTPASVTASDEKPFKVGLKHKVDAYKVFIQAKLPNGKTAEKELKITVSELDCKGIDSIKLAADDTKVYSFAKPSDDSETKVVSDVDIKALFTIEETSKTKKEDCSKLKYKLLEMKPGFIFEEVAKDDELVSMGDTGELTIKKAKASTTAKEFYIVAYPEGKESNNYSKKSIKIQISSKCEYTSE